MNRNFFPIAGGGLLLASENVASPPQQAARLSAAWSPVIFGRMNTAGGVVASNPTTMPTISGHIIQIDGPNLPPTATNIYRQATVFVVPPRSSFVVTPNTRTGGPFSASATDTLGTPRGQMAIDIQTERSSSEAVAAGFASVVIGSAGQATGDYGIAIGNGGTGNGQDSVAIGTLANAANVRNIAIGASANATGSQSAIAIGYSAYATGQNATCINGFASGDNSVALGKSSNAINTDSVAIGNQSRADTASRNYAMGYFAQAQHQNAISIGSVAQSYWRAAAHFGFGTNVQTFAIAEHQKTTTDATATLLLANDTAGQTLTFATNSAITFRVQIVAREAATGDAAGWSIEGVGRRVAGNVELLGSVQTSSYASAGAAAWLASVVADVATQGLAVQVTGEAAKTIKWLAYWQVTRVA